VDEAEMPAEEFQRKQAFKSQLLEQARRRSRMHVLHLLDSLRRQQLQYCLNTCTCCAS